MERDEILAGIREVAVEHLGWHGELPLDARLAEDLELDSMRLLTLAVEVENRFRVALEPEDEEEIATLRDLVDAVERRLSEKGNGTGADSPSEPARDAAPERGSS